MEEVDVITKGKKVEVQQPPPPKYWITPHVPPPNGFHRHECSPLFPSYMDDAFGSHLIRKGMWFYVTKQAPYRIFQFSIADDDVLGDTVVRMVPCSSSGDFARYQSALVGDGYSPYVSLIGSPVAVFMFAMVFPLSPLCPDEIIAEHECHYRNKWAPQTPSSFSIFSSCCRHMDAATMVYAEYFTPTHSTDGMVGVIAAFNASKDRIVEWIRTGRRFPVETKLMEQQIIYGYLENPPVITKAWTNNDTPHEDNTLECHKYLKVGVQW